MNEELKNKVDTFLNTVEQKYTRIKRKKFEVELQRFVSYISASDSSIAEGETNFINEYLDTGFTMREYANFIAANDTHSHYFETTIPEIFAEFLEKDNELLLCYLELCNDLGRECIVSDQNAEMKEIDNFNHYMTMLQGAYEKKHPDYHFEFRRSTKEDVFSKNEKKEEETLEDLLNELNGLIGLKSVKKNVLSLMHLQEIQKERERRGLPRIPMSNHLVFTGNPGTGKTTIARLIAKIYHKIGLLPTDRFVEVDRSGMVAGYVGQTAIEVKNVVDNAMGGVLFIDEAYSLANGLPGDYGNEAIETLLKRMEDNRQEIIVIVAGYPKLMENFINANPGLRSRFSKKIHFPDYTPDELLEILYYMCKQNHFTISDEAAEYAFEAFERKYEKRDEHFANAREVRNFFEAGVVSQADRLYGQADITDEQLCRLEVDDFRYNELTLNEE